MGTGKANSSTFVSQLVGVRVGNALCGASTCRHSNNWLRTPSLTTHTKQRLCESKQNVLTVCTKVRKPSSKWDRDYAFDFTVHATPVPPVGTVSPLGVSACTANGLAVLVPHRGRRRYKPFSHIGVAGCRRATGCGNGPPRMQSTTPDRRVLAGQLPLMEPVGTPACKIVDHQGLCRGYSRPAGLFTLRVPEALPLGYFVPMKHKSLRVPQIPDSGSQKIRCFFPERNRGIARERCWAGHARVTKDPKLAECHPSHLLKRGFTGWNKLREGEALRASSCDYCTQHVHANHVHANHHVPFRSSDPSVSSFHVPCVCESSRS